MIVYRYTTEVELKYVLNGEKDKLGNYNSKNKDWSICNTHKYQSNHKYLHFFKDKPSIEYLKKIRKTESGKPMFICFYDIPKSILKCCKGKGFYDPDASGYDYLEIKLVEYAIDVENFDCAWLVHVEEDKNNYEIEIKENEV